MSSQQPNQTHPHGSVHGIALVGLALSMATAALIFLHFRQQHQNEIHVRLIEQEVRLSLEQDLMPALREKNLPKARSILDTSLAKLYAAPARVDPRLTAIVLGDLCSLRLDLLSQAANPADPLELREILGLLDGAISLDGADEMIWYLRGITCTRLQDFHGAVKNLDTAISLNAYFGAAWLARSHAHESLNQPDHAVRDREQAHNLGVDSIQGMLAQELVPILRMP